MKNKILEIFLLGVLVVSLTGCGNKSVLVKENQEYELNSEVKIMALISDENELEIINKDDVVDTSKVGEKKVTIKYKDKKNEKEQVIKINVVDTTKPIIEYTKELTTTEGSEIDLLKGVKVMDNSNEEITPTIEGEYDINKVGTYNLKYVAQDSSGNKTEEEFVLKVNKKVVKSIKVGSSTLYFGKYKMEGDIPDGYTGTVTISSDGKATSTGYYYDSTGHFVKKNLIGTWSVQEKSIAGLVGLPEDNIKVDGILFSWSNGEKIAFGLSTKYFGDQFHGYRWYSE